MVALFFGLGKIGFVLRILVLSWGLGGCGRVRESGRLPMFSMFTILIRMGRAFGIGFVFTPLSAGHFVLSSYSEDIYVICFLYIIGFVLRKCCRDMCDLPRSYDYCIWV